MSDFQRVQEVHFPHGRVEMPFIVAAGPYPVRKPLRKTTCGLTPLHPVAPGRLQHMMDDLAYKEAQRLNFCTLCGKETLGDCHNCHMPLKPDERRPSYCGGCGKPFPWTEQALSTAREYTDELDLTSAEKADLKGTFLDLAEETPRTPLAINRFQKYMQKLGPVASATMKEIINSVVADGVKRLMEKL